ncbi:MAG: hypothetical protein IJN63_07370 [Clostridia bacterium]|nr:hypothetical protein [Clostridia bacterium]
MKKVITIALAIAIAISCFGFASCGKQLTPYETVEAALAKNAELDCLEANQTIKMKMDMMGMSIEMPITGVMKATGIKSGNPVMYSKASTSMMGTTVDTEAYIEGDYIYLTTMGESYKAKASSLASDYDVLKDINSMLQLPPESVFEGVEPVKNEDGTTTYSFTMSEEDYLATYRPFFDSMSESLGVSGDESGLKIGNVAISLSIDKNGFVCGYDMSFNMEVSVTEMGTQMDIKCDVVCELDFVNIGGNVTITPPEGYKDFEEVDASVIG